MKSNKLGFGLIEIMIIIAITALLAVFTLPNLLRKNMANNVSAAWVVLKTVSTASENYALANKGNYPTSVIQLTTATTEGLPPYLNENYCDNKVRSGYVFNCTFNTDNTGYIITARPKRCGVTADKSFTMITGGILSTDAICLAAGR